MADSTLTAIETKVRRLTRSLSEAQLTTAQIDEYINTFVLYDFPEHLRLFNLRTTFSFYTQPYVDVYATNTTDTTNPMYNFKNKYITIHPPVYIAGYQAMVSQSREQFFGIYPLLSSIASIGTAGDGTTTSFSGTINTQQANLQNINQQQYGLLQNNVLFSSVDASGNGLTLIDSPIVDSSTGIPTVWGLLYTPNNPPSALPLALPAPYDTDPGFPTTNYINYATGNFTITFPTAPASGIAINSQTVPTVIALPQAVLFYDGAFTVRPVPDQPYKINMEAYIRPTELLSAGQSPELQEWWQYIAYGAAKKVFEDRMDMESVQMIMPEYKMQERLILRRTLVQYSNDRAATIYSQQTDRTGAYGPGFQWGNW